MTASDESTGGDVPASDKAPERRPTALRWCRRGAVPLRIAPLVVVGIIFVVLAVLGATTL